MWCDDMFSHVERYKYFVNCSIILLNMIFKILFFIVIIFFRFCFPSVAKLTIVFRFWFVEINLNQSTFVPFVEFSSRISMCFFCCCYHSLEQRLSLRAPWVGMRIGFSPDPWTIQATHIRIKCIFLEKRNWRCSETIASIRQHLWFDC